MHILHHQYVLANYNKNLIIVSYKLNLILKILIIFKNLKIFNKKDYKKYIV